MSNQIDQHTRVGLSSRWLEIEGAPVIPLHIVPITTESLIDLDSTARARVEAEGRLCAVASITSVVSARWTDAARTVLAGRRE